MNRADIQTGSDVVLRYALENMGKLCREFVIALKGRFGVKPFDFIIEQEKIVFCQQAPQFFALLQNPVAVKELLPRHDNHFSVLKCLDGIGCGCFFQQTFIIRYKRVFHGKMEGFFGSFCISQVNTQQTFVDKEYVFGYGATGKQGLFFSKCLDAEPGSIIVPFGFR